VRGERQAIGSPPGRGWGWVFLGLRVKLMIIVETFLYPPQTPPEEGISLEYPRISLLDSSPG